MHDLESLVNCKIPIMVGYSPTTIFSTTNDEGFVIIPIFTDANKANKYRKKLYATLLKERDREIILLTIGSIEKVLFTLGLDKSATYYIAVDPASPSDEVLVHTLYEAIAAFGDKSS